MIDDPKHSFVQQIFRFCIDAKQQVIVNCNSWSTIMTFVVVLTKYMYNHQLCFDLT